jgi:hypothetical protein
LAVQPNDFLRGYLDPIQESKENSFSYNPSVQEYGDIAGLGIFKQLFDKARRGYGQVDKNVFGGLLPGGAATPLGAKFQEIQERTGEPPSLRHFGGPATYSKTATLLDTIATRLAGSQPFVEDIVKKSPNFVKQTLADTFNSLPISANLFSRYYTGIGNENLQIPNKLTDTVSRQVLRDQASLNAPKSSSEYAAPSQKEMEEFTIEQAQKRLSAINSGIIEDKTGKFRRTANDELAESRSNLAKLNSGQIQYSPYSNMVDKGNSSDSPVTSFGRLWLKPTPTGFQANERYDFHYANADNSFNNNIINTLTPSQKRILTVVNELQKRNPFNTSSEKPSGNDYYSLANYDPLTAFGQAIVMKMKGKPFDYKIDFPVTK